MNGTWDNSQTACAVRYLVLHGVGNEKVAWEASRVALFNLLQIGKGEWYEKTEACIIHIVW